MVTFKKDRFVIEVITKTNPIESWLETVDQMIDLLQSEDNEMHDQRFHYCELLREMMPDIETAKKMINTNE